MDMTFPGSKLFRNASGDSVLRLFNKKVIYILISGPLEGPQALFTHNMTYFLPRAPGNVIKWGCYLLMKYDLPMVGIVQKHKQEPYFMFINQKTTHTLILGPSGDPFMLF